MRFTLRLLPSYLILCSITAAEPAITEQELVRRTQELYDAVASGNQAPWKKYFADDCIYSDEKGRIFDKPKLIADITPLPQGYSGAIKIDKVHSRVMGAMAVLSYDANESEAIFGQNMTARYHITDTWLRRNGEWQIIASQAHRYYEDPAIGQADVGKFDGYTGTYEVAPGQTRVITAEGDKLFMQRFGQKDQPTKKEQLLPEATDLFFRRGIEGRVLFHYGRDGAVDSLIDRRNNEDVTWEKVSSK